MSNLKVYNPITAKWEPLKLNTRVTSLKNTVTLPANMNYCDIGISEFNPADDNLMVYKDGLYLENGKEYILSGGSLRVQSMDGADWRVGTVFHFVVIKNTERLLPSSDGSLIQPGSLTNDKLAPSIQIAPALINNKGFSFGSLDARLKDLDQSIENLEAIGVDIRKFGAKGDGTDITNILQAAINSVTANGLKHGVINISSGVYAVNLSTNCNNVTFIGNGRIIPVEGKTDYALQLTGDRNKIIGLTFDETKFNYSPLDIKGNYNLIEKCRFTSPAKSTVGEVVYSNVGLRIDGSYNDVSECEIYNQEMGIKVLGTGHRIVNNNIHDNITGIHLVSSCRDVEIGYNNIYSNNVNSDSGADGILAHRNVSRIHIHHNVIRNNGEHGLYFQGDSSIISDNIVMDNSRSGLKFASYSTGLHDWDVAAKGEYISFANIISNNVCIGNALSEADTNAGIYVQSPAKQYIIEGNMVSGNSNGIKLVFLSDTHVLEEIKIDGNRCEKSTIRDIYAQANKGLSIINNAASTVYIYGSNPNATVKPTIKNNEVDQLDVNRTYRALISDNKISNKLSVNANNSEAIVKNNNIVMNASNLLIDKISIFDNNEVDIIGDFEFTSSVIPQLKSFCFNVITAKDQASDYIFDGSFNGYMNGLRFIGNSFDTGNVNKAVVELWGDNMIVKDNYFSNTSGAILDINGRFGVIANNVAQSKVATIIIRENSNNIVTGNYADVPAKKGGVYDNNIQENVQVMQSADGSSWKVYIDNAGNVKTIKI